MKKVNYLSTYEEDCIWMSYRYCIGRHTIASHCHASDIANNAYGRMSKERTQFMSKDINKIQKSTKSLKKYRFYMLFSRISIYLQNS